MQLHCSSLTTRLPDDPVAYQADVAIGEADSRGREKGWERINKVADWGAGTEVGQG